MCFSSEIRISEHPQQKEICADVCVTKILMAPSIRGTCLNVYSDAKSRKFESTILIQTICSSQRLFSSNLKQFLRTCSSIVKTYFEMILGFEQKFFGDFSRFRITIHIQTCLSY